MEEGQNSCATAVMALPAKCATDELITAARRQAIPAKITANAEISLAVLNVNAPWVLKAFYVNIR